MARRLQVLMVLAIFLSICGSVMGASYVPPCGLIIYQLSPCVPYMTGQEKDRETACCNGVRHLNNSNNDKEEQESICNCLKSAAPMYGGLDFSLISSLPRKRGVSLKIPKVDSANFDCSNA